MTNLTPDRAIWVRRTRLAVGVALGIALVGLVEASFLVWMSTLPDDTAMARTLVLGAVVAGVGCVVAVALAGAALRGGVPRSLAWAGTLLPVAGAVVAALLAALTGLWWLGVPLALMAGLPVAFVAFTVRGLAPRLR